MRAEPTTCPLSSWTRLPLAWRGNRSWPRPVRSRGYAIPVSTSVTAVARRAMRRTRAMGTSLDQVADLEDEVDELDADERRDQAPEAVDEQRAPQERRRPERPVAHAAQRQRDEQDDDDRV